MKVSIARGFQADGSVYQLDTATRSSKNVFWSTPNGSSRILAFYLGDSEVRGIYASADATLTAAFSGETLESPVPVAITPLPGTAMSNQNMTFTPDGRFAFGLSASGASWVSVDFSLADPALFSQPTGSFPNVPNPAQRGFMSFADGSSRIVYLDPNAAVMYLSTKIGNGEPINTELALPLSGVPVAGEFEGYEAYAINGTVILGGLAESAKSGGLGTPTVMDLWLVASDGTHLLAQPYTGKCTARSANGEQTAGFLDGLILKELLVRKDFSHQTSYSEGMPEELINMPGFSAVFVDLSIPTGSSQFWNRFVRCFEEAQTA